MLGEPRDPRLETRPLRNEGELGFIDKTEVSAAQLPYAEGGWRMSGALWLGLSLLDLVADAGKIVLAHLFVCAWSTQDTLSHQKQPGFASKAVVGIWFAMRALAMVDEEVDSVGLVEEPHIANLIVLLHSAAVVGDGQLVHEGMQLGL